MSIERWSAAIAAAVKDREAAERKFAEARQEHLRMSLRVSRLEEERAMWTSQSDRQAKRAHGVSEGGGSPYSASMYVGIARGPVPREPPAYCPDHGWFDGHKEDVAGCPACRNPFGDASVTMSMSHADAKREEQREDERYQAAAQENASTHQTPNFPGSPVGRTAAGR